MSQKSYKDLVLYYLISVRGSIHQETMGPTLTLEEYTFSQRYCELQKGCFPSPILFHEALTGNDNLRILL